MIIRKVTQNCIDLVKYFEGFSYKPYICAGGYKTILTGHIITVNENFDYITKDNAEQEGERILHMDLIKSEMSVLRLIHIPLEDYQYDALCSWTFNLGGGALQRSTLRSKINRKEHDLVPDEFRKWVYANGRILKGLVRRRITEAHLYTTGELII